MTVAGTIWLTHLMSVPFSSELRHAVVGLKGREIFPQPSCSVLQSRVMQSPSAIHLAHWVHGGFVDPIISLLQSVFDVSLFVCV